MGTLTIFVVFAIGLVNIRLETDPQSLWVSHDSIGYEQETNFNDNFGAFFRTEQIIMAQVLFFWIRTTIRRETYSITITFTDSISCNLSLIRKECMSMTERLKWKTFAISQSASRDATVHLLWTYGKWIWGHWRMILRLNTLLFALKPRSPTPIHQICLAPMRMKSLSSNNQFLEE